MVAPDALRLLTVARRGEAVRVGRIDLASRRSDHWGEIKTRVFARHFDGQTWLVEQSHGDGRDAELLVLDVLDERPSARSARPVAGLERRRDSSRGTRLQRPRRRALRPLERLRDELPAFTSRERSKSCLEEHGDGGCLLFGQDHALQGDDPPVVLERWFEFENAFSGRCRSARRSWRGLIANLPAPDLR